MKTIIIGILSFATGIFIGLTFGKVLNWNAITAIATLIMSLCAILALFDWKKEQKLILYKDRRDALKQLHAIILRLDEVHKRLMPSFIEILPLLSEINEIKVHLGYNNELKNTIKNYCDTYSNIYYYMDVINRIGNEDYISQETKNVKQAQIYNMINDWVCEIPETTKNLKNIIQENLEA